MSYTEVEQEDKEPTVIKLTILLVVVVLALMFIFNLVFQGMK